MTTQRISPAYRDAVTEVIAAEGAFWEASISEAIRLIPAGVSALIFRINDTPRLAFDAYLDQDGTEHEAEQIDGGGGDLSLFDALDEIAMQLNVHEHDDAATWLLTYSGERFVEVGADGRATALLQGDMQAGDVIAVTVEPAGGSPNGLPSTDPIVVIPTA